MTWNEKFHTTLLKILNQLKVNYKIKVKWVSQFYKNFKDYYLFLSKSFFNIGFLWASIFDIISKFWVNLKHDNRKNSV